MIINRLMCVLWTTHAVQVYVFRVGVVEAGAGSREYAHIDIDIDTN